MAVEIVDIGPDLEPVVRRQRAGSMRGPATTIIRRPGTCAFASGNAAMTRRSRSPPTPEPPTVTMQTCSLRPVSELVAQLLAVGDGLEPGHVPREVVVLLRPVADPGQLGAERVRHDVLRVADEDGPVADPREARDVLDHLGVVVGGEEGLVLASVLERQPADEVGQPDVGRRLQLRVLVQEVVDLPRLVADPEVVVLVAHHVEEEHEVGDEDLVHPPDRLEGVQVVLGRLALDVRRLVREQRARRMDALPFGLEHGRDRMLREPVDLEVRMELAAAPSRSRRRGGHDRARSARRRRARVGAG